MIERYRDLIVNRADAYARQSQDGGAYYCIREPVTDQVIKWHLEGNITCGFYCLNQDNTVKWAVVDVDEEEEGIFIAQTIHQRLAKLELPSYIEESRNGRAHLWLFNAPWPARPIRVLLRCVVDNDQIEIFPKQDGLGVGQVGSAVRGPLGIHRKTYQFYPFLDPETLERIPDRRSYLLQIKRAGGNQLAGALNALLRERRAVLPEPKERVVYNARTGDTLAVARVLNIPLDDKDHYFQGICPFHPDERHPSFSIYPASDLWVCWHDRRMGKGGVSLYAAVRGISIAEAEEILKELL